MMGSCWQNWHLQAKNILIEPFYIITTSLLNLLLPLSFIVLARISCAQYLSSSIIISYPTEPFSSFFFSSLYTTLLYILVSSVSIATLVQSLTGKLTIIPSEPPAGNKIHQPTHLCTAWIFLCTLQACVGLGIEGSIAAGFQESAGFGGGVERRSLISRVVFFLGLHETTLVWFRKVVKPVVDDVCFRGGVSREERWVDRAAMAISFGGLWWLKLRDEVESLVVVAEAKKEMLMSVGVSDFVGWWLYYLTVTVGMVRVVKGLLWLGMILLFRRVIRRRNNAAGHACDEDDDGIDNKV